MRPPSHIRASNKLLLEAFGHHGAYPRYEWILGSDPRLTFEARVWDGVPTGVQDPQSGLWLPRTPQRKVPFLAGLGNEWILCIRRDLADLGYPTEYHWRRQFGADFTYPGDSLWWPVEAPGGWASHPNPDEAFTRRVIETIRKDRKTTLAEASAEASARVESKEKSHKDKLEGKLRDVLPDRFGIPGSRSYPHWHRRPSQERAIIE